MYLYNTYRSDRIDTQPNRLCIVFKNVLFEEILFYKSEKITVLGYLFRFFSDKIYFRVGQPS